MQDNPYSELVRVLRQDAKEQFPTNYRFGKVVSAIPLRLEVAGTIQEKKDLRKSSELPTLLVGDICFLVPMEDEQKYLILCKVVNA